METRAITLDQLMGDPAYYPVSVPDGESNGWRVITREIDMTTCLMENIKHLAELNYEATVSPGTYKVLVTPAGKVMMSNTQLEYRTNKDFVESAYGDVLVLGLGLGMLIRPLLNRPEVTSLTIVELEEDVISLVAPSYADLQDKLTIINASAFEFIPSSRYSIVYHDIWPMINGNEEEMAALEAHYEPYTDEQQFWCRDHEQVMIDRWRELLAVAKEAKQNGR